MYPIFFSICLGLLCLGCSDTTQKSPKQSSKTAQKTVATITKESLHVELQSKQKELLSVHSLAYLETYIQEVITHGSSGLGYPGGAMDAGFASQQDSQDIARYVVMLTGQKSSDDTKGAKAAIFYTSNCGGCHGHDGKGLNGSFPNLTVLPYKGILRKEESLKRRIKELNALLDIS